MKKNRWAAWLLIAVCVLGMAVPAFARASDQIGSYSVKVYALSGQIAVEFSVAGNVKMEKIGCESIYLYKKVDGSWVFVESRFENDEDMSDTKTISHTADIYFNTTAGTEYKVVTTIFAEDSSARDSRTRVSFVTGK